MKKDNQPQAAHAEFRCALCLLRQQPEDVRRCTLIRTKETLHWQLEYFEVVKYASGDKMHHHKGLTFDHFEYAYPMKMTHNTIDQKEFYHFFCTSSTQETLVIARLKDGIVMIGPSLPPGYKIKF